MADSTKTFKLPQMSIAGTSTGRGAAPARGRTPKEAGDAARKKSSITFTQEEYRKVRILAAEEGRKINDVISEALEDLFKKYGIE